MMFEVPIDARQFVRPEALPITSQKGMLIQARSQQVYNPTVPTRDEVRRINYARRQAQMSQQGFRSVNYRPYLGIGDPFYLDKKKLIMHALGQWNEGEDCGDTSSDDSSDDDEHLTSSQKKSTMASRGYIHRKSRNDLNTLNKEIYHGRDLIKNVRLGHGLFQLLQRENERRTEDKQKELQKRREKMWNEWQPPKSEEDSDSDVSEDDELNTEVDLRRFMVASSVFEGGEEDPTDPEASQVPPEAPMLHQSTLQSTFLTQSQETKPIEHARSVVFRDVYSSATSHTNHMTDFAKSTISVNLSSARSKSKKNKGPPPRPFTPQHSNIGADYNRVVTQEHKDALFRQLCALYWLLEAMNCNDPTLVSPIATSWNIRDIGGSKISPVIKQQREKSEARWRREFTTNQAYKPHMKRYSGARQGSMRSGMRRGSIMARGSVSSTCTPSGSQSQLNLSGSGSALLTAPPGGTSRRLDHAAIPEYGESVTLTEQDGEEDKDKAKSSGDPSEAVETDNKPVSTDNKDHSTADGANHSDMSTSRRNSARNRDFPQKRHSSASPKRSVTIPVDKKEQQKALAQVRILDSINRSEEDPRLHRLAHPTEKRSSTSLRAEYNVRPKSTQAVLDYQSSLPSTHCGELPTKLRLEFNDVTEEKAQTLHDTLEAVDRDRMRKLRTMFVRVPTRTSLHKALDTIRPKATNPDDEKDKRRRSSLHQQWYLDIINAVPDEVKQDWIFERILSKLSKYGLVEASKQSAFKFRRVMKGLRDWEICSPDICAAIEFCREKIIEMSVEDYEEWFTETFPSVVRPQTAPPVAKNTKNDKSSKAVAPKSAPPGGRLKTR